MNFPQAIKSFYKKSFDFSSRAVRSEYWYSFLFNSLVTVLLLALGNANNIFALSALIFRVVILVPTISLGFRRYHDLGKSALYPLLLKCLPFAVIVMSLIWDLMPDSYYEDTIALLAVGITLWCAAFPFDLYYMMKGSPEGTAFDNIRDIRFISNLMPILSLCLSLIVGISSGIMYIAFPPRGCEDPRPHSKLIYAIPTAIIFVMHFLAIMIKDKKALASSLLVSCTIIMSAYLYKTNYHFSSQEATYAGSFVYFEKFLGLSVVCALLLLYFLISMIRNKLNKKPLKHLCFMPYAYYLLFLVYLLANNRTRRYFQFEGGLLHEYPNFYLPILISVAMNCIALYAKDSIAQKKDE